ncbi:MAG: dTDP-4-dehydrorhamnose reductase [Thermodesulfobacteriota bacterium]|nr:dTDP-4-dehydrorhamnose reductase [Thermodesulfobacteriota bacterium]
MKLLICGGKGQLGTDCHAILARNHEVMSVDLDELDITDPLQVESAIAGFGPNVIVNCAAYTAVDACETRSEMAWKVNAEGPRNLAAAAKRYGAQLIHISTDYVFDGGKAPPESYVETDETHPVSCYGRSKLAGENAVKEATNNYMILRTAWLYGIGGPNFLKTMLSLTLKDPTREIKVVNDQFGSPTWSYRLALQIEKLINEEGQGVYHATAEGHGTWFQLASEFLDQMVVPHCVVPCTTADYPTLATRPMNSILENRRLKESGMNLMQDWRSDLRQFVAEFRDRLISEAREEPR